MQPMRINKFVALCSTSMSRRAADRAVEMGRIKINDELAAPGSLVRDGDRVTIDDRPLTPPKQLITVVFNKPTGYVCSKRGQGSQTIYDLLPESFRSLNPIGRLDKDSSGILLLTNGGNRVQDLTHPSKQKTKIYEIKLDKPLSDKDVEKIASIGVLLGDGESRLQLAKLGNSPLEWKVSMYEGRNRQIRRTFQAIDYKVTHIHRTHFGPYKLGDLGVGSYKIVK